MALGRRKMLRGRKPEYQWFRELLNRVDGPVGKDEDEGKIDWAELVPAAQRRAMERQAATRAGADRPIAWMQNDGGRISPFSPNDRAHKTAASPAHIYWCHFCHE